MDSCCGGGGGGGGCCLSMRVCEFVCSIETIECVSHDGVSVLLLLQLH